MSILSLSFNNTNSHLTCSTDTSYIIYGLEPTFEKKMYYEMSSGLKLMKIFNRTNLSLMVGGGSNPYKPDNILVLWDENKKECLLEINVKEPILNALIEKDMIIVVLEKKIIIFDWLGNSLHTKDTFTNLLGLATINKNSVLCTLGNKIGELAIYDILNNKYKIIEAHKTNIISLALNNSGTLVATASETGTLIRVFDIETAKPVYEFRRGTSTAVIYSMCFNNDSTKLACSSGNGTIHIFDLYKNKSETKNTESMLSSFKNYLPEYFGSQWGYKQHSLGINAKTICCFDEKNNLNIVSYDGKYYKISGQNYNTITEGQLYHNNK